MGENFRKIRILSLIENLLVVIKVLPERHRSRTIKGLFICQGCGSTTHCEFFYVTI